MSKFGYAIKEEPREEIYSRTAIAYAHWRDTFDEYDWEPPAEVDPRPWFQMENQRNIGACQGFSLSCCVEMCHVIQHGEPIQLSPGFAYLDSQKQGNMIGRDSGSTLDGGTKCARKGLPLEDNFPYVANYRTLYDRYRQSRSIARPYSLEGELPLATWEDAYRFLSSWQGCIQIGIAWTLGSQWEVKSYRYGRGGGHAVNFVGYLKVRSWPGGIGFLLKNSWGSGWGRDGYALVHPHAYDQMFKHSWNIAIGRSDMPKPVPRIEVNRR